MALFQASVLKSHLALLDEAIIEKAYKKYQKYFWNTTIQGNIRSAKEEQYQATFLNELFVNILGYTLFPNPNSNLTTEFKNEKNARKADGAILKDGVALGVIELKGTNTKDLESIRKQAFDYKANHKGCVYIITSNFEKLRFYINDATEFEEFDLFTLSLKRFKLMYLCLHRDKVLNNAPLKIKEESIVEEEQITKGFYKDYSIFKRELFRDLVKNNSKTVRAKLSESDQKDNQDDILRLEKNVKLTLFKKSQKLIDRFLFIFFAEDRMLLPNNSTRQILDKWKDDWDFGDERPLYNLFKQYFNFLDQGRKGTEKRAEIYAYNGGLFKPDAILDALEIDNDLLFKYTLKLSNYDFESQVDVNILGHIFENSLNEIESVNAEIEGGDFDKQTSKRKKDGVFYTPKYITKYIVENTIGKLCEEKKLELKITEERFADAKKRSKQGIAALESYRNWLLQLTICDPACGSGAFLNEALDFLITEHTYLDELQAKYHGGFAFPDIENTILENNIYGVDLNEESVEIAKLSLWLRTAQPRRKLNDLSSNVKCGNSLIDSKTLAGDKAFNWNTEFLQVFENGGFDVVIGNPPYVRQELFTVIKPYLQTKYKVYQGQADLYTYFFEKGIDILKDNGLFSIIVANKWLKVSYADELRSWLQNIQVDEIIDFGDLPVFSDASAYPCIVTLKNSIIENDTKVTIVKNLDFSSLSDYVSENKYFVDQTGLEKDSWRLIDKRQGKLLKKLNLSEFTLHSYTKGAIRRGIVTGMNEAFVINEETKDILIKEHQSSKEIIKPFLAGRNINKYSIQFEDTYLIFTRRGINIDDYPAIKSYLEKFRNRLEPKPKGWKGVWEGRKTGSYKWYEIQDSIDYYKEFEKGKIIYPNICNEPSFCVDNENFYTNQKCFIIPIEDYSLLGIMNSKVFSFLFEMNLPKLRGGYYEPSYIHIKNFPLPVINIEIGQKIELLAHNMSNAHKELNNNLKKFSTYISFKFSLLKKTRKLENWQELDFTDFIKELNKAIKVTNKERVKEDLELIDTLTKLDEMEWMDAFETKKKKALELQSQITQTEAEIDQMVYALYGLTDDEVAIIEKL